MQDASEQLSFPGITQGTFTSCSHRGFLKLLDIDGDGQSDLLLGGSGTKCNAQCVPEFLAYRTSSNRYLDVSDEYLGTLNFRGLIDADADLADTDSDGRTDMFLIGATQLGGQLRVSALLRNTGSGLVDVTASRFVIPPPPLHRGLVRFGSFSASGRRDLLLCGGRNDLAPSDLSYVGLFAHLSNGSFAPSAFDLPPDFAFPGPAAGFYDPTGAVFDVNGDGLDDIYLSGRVVDTSSNSSMAVRSSVFVNRMLAINLGNGTFANGILASGALLVTPQFFNGDAAAADFDRDGAVDLVLGGDYPVYLSAFEQLLFGFTPFSVLRGFGNGSFAFTLQTAGPGNCSGCAVALLDADEDGDIDMLVSGRTGVNAFQLPVAEFFTMLNDGSPGNIHFIDGPVSSSQVPVVPGVETGSIAVERTTSTEPAFFVTVVGGHPIVSTVEAGTLATFTLAVNFSTPWIRRQALPEYRSSLFSSNAYVFDYNSDGALDVMVAGFSGRSVPILRMLTGLGDGTFFETLNVFDALPDADQRIASPFADIADWNRDGYLDIILDGTTSNVLPWAQGYTQLLVFNPLSQLYDLVGPRSSLRNGRPMFVDIDVDGLLDLFVQGRTDALFVYAAEVLRQLPNGSLADITADVFPPGFEYVQKGAGPNLFLQLDDGPRMDLLSSGIFAERVLIPFEATEPFIYTAVLRVYTALENNLTMVDTTTSSLPPSVATVGFGHAVAVNLVSPDVDDVFLVGQTDTYVEHAYLLRNLLNGSFADASDTLPSSARGLLFALYSVKQVAFNGAVLNGVHASGFYQPFPWQGTRYLLVSNGNGTLRDITAEVGLDAFRAPEAGTAIFGDFNGDELTDVLQFGSMTCPPDNYIIQTPEIVASSSGSGDTGGDGGGDGAATAGAVGAGVFAAIASMLAVVGVCVLIFVAIICCLLLLIVVVVALAAAVLLAVGLALAVGSVSFAGSTAALLKMKGGDGGGEAEFDEVDPIDVAEVLEGLPVDHVEFGDVSIGDKIGGNEAGMAVYAATWMNVDVALKVVRQAAGAELVVELCNDATVQARLAHHRYIADVVFVAYDAQRVAMATPYYSNRSLDVVLRGGSLSETQKLRVLVCVASALSFVHSEGVVHRDVAARNVLIDAAMEPKLSDFGMARVLAAGVGGVFQGRTTKSTVGPVRWMAPESIARAQYSLASDAYSFGVLIWETLHDGAVPFSDIDSLADVAIAVTRRRMRPALTVSASPELLELMHHLFDEDPAKRPTLAVAHRRLQTLLGEAHSSDVSESVHSSEYGNFSQLDKPTYGKFSQIDDKTSDYGKFSQIDDKMSDYGKFSQIE